MVSNTLVTPKDNCIELTAVHNSKNEEFFDDERTDPFRGGEIYEEKST